VGEYAVKRDGSIAVCPGLNSLGCGEPKKKGQTYCPQHNREYQRERYRGVRIGAGAAYSERDYTRVETKSACGACGGIFKEGLVVITGFLTEELPAVCIECRDYLELAYRERSFGRLMAIAEFLVEHKKVLASHKKTSDEFDRILRERFETYFYGFKYDEDMSYEEGWEKIVLPPVDGFYGKLVDEIVREHGAPIPTGSGMKDESLREFAAMRDQLRNDIEQKKPRVPPVPSKADRRSTSTPPPVTSERTTTEVPTKAPKKTKTRDPNDLSDLDPNDRLESFTPASTPYVPERWGPPQSTTPTTDA
jgi:hypothetical protein